MIAKYFKQASPCEPDRRGVGFEVETLFVNKETGLPISRDDARKIFLRLVGEFGWKVEEAKGDMLVRISHTTPIVPTAKERCSVHFTPEEERGIYSYRYDLIFDLGWNNIELITPVWSATYTNMIGLWELESRLEEINRAAEYYGAIPTGTCYDGHADEDTLVMPDKRDEIWKELDGPVLPVLGHIASVHVNIDLASIDEGFEFIRRLNAFYSRQSWPPANVQDIWRRYITESHADYEPGRYGPPPETFDAYIETMAGYKVVMNRMQGSGGSLFRTNPALAYRDMPKDAKKTMDFEMFLRSIWWWSRLRVRDGNLVLEARAIPRGSNADLQRDILDLLKAIGFGIGV